jgi:hypothetical protein
MTNMRRTTLLAIITFGLSCGVCAQTPPSDCSGAVTESTPQIQDVLKAACVPFPESPSIETGLPITSYEVLNRPSQFILAYYVANGLDLLEPPLRLLRYDKLTARWDTAEFSEIETEAGAGLRAPCLGSAVGITEAGDMLYVGLHLSPSAECLLVLSRDLKLKHTLYGWPVASFSSGTIVLQKSMVHFAPTHPLELSIFDPVSDTLTPMYPPQPDPFRAEYVRRLQTDISPSDRCEGYNCEGNPQRFDNDFAFTCAPIRCTSQIATNEKTGALAFIAQFSPIGFLRFDKVKSSVEWSEQVVYVYRIFPGPLEYRAFRPTDLQERFGITSLDALLTPESLARVFQ